MTQGINKHSIDQVSHNIPFIASEELRTPMLLWRDNAELEIAWVIISTATI